MSRSLPLLLVALLLTSGHSLRSQAPRFQLASRFQADTRGASDADGIDETARTPITRAKFPAIDFHLHARELKTANNYHKMIQVMDQTGIGMISNMDGGFGPEFDRNMKVGEPFRDRVRNLPGWTSMASTIRAGRRGPRRNSSAIFSPAQRA